MSSTAAQVTADPPQVTPQRRRGAALAPLLIVCGVLAALVATGLSVVSGSGETYTALGLPDPGTLTNFGLPALRALTEASAALAIGSLLFAGFLTPPQRSGVLAADGYAALLRQERGKESYVGIDSLDVVLCER